MSTWNPLEDMVRAVLLLASEDGGPFLRARLGKTMLPSKDGRLGGPREVFWLCALSVSTPGCRDEIPVTATTRKDALNDPQAIALRALAVIRREVQSSANRDPATVGWQGLLAQLDEVREKLTAISAPNVELDPQVLTFGMPTPSVEAIQQHCRAGGLWRIVDRRHDFATASDMVHEAGALHLRRVLQDPGDRDRWWPLTRDGLLTALYTAESLT